MLKERLWWPRAAVILLAVLIPTLSVIACLDVAVSPGTPMQWLFEFPFHGSRPERGTVPTRLRSEEPATPARTRAVRPRQTERIAAVPRTRDAMAFARIITSDILTHIPWVTFQQEKVDTAAWPQAAQAGLPSAYPPRLTEDIHWFAMGAILRHLLHADRVSLPETRALLLRLGSAVRRPLNQAATVGGDTGALVQELNERIPALPINPPALRAEGQGDRFLAMAEKLALVELSTSFGYSLEGPFAPRSRSLGDEALPAFRRLLTHPHPLVRENAVLLLSGFDHPEAGEALRALVTRSRDPVCVARAIHALADWRSSDTIKTLTALLSDRSVEVMAIEALGRIGERDAALAIRRAIGRNSDPDFLLTAVPALGRSDDPDPENRKLLLKVRSHFSRSPAAGPKRVGAFAPDQPDPPGFKHKVIQQLATIALARLGEPQAREEVLKWVVTGQENPPIQGQRRIVRIAQDSIPPVLGPCTYEYLEALATLGPQGTAALAALFKGLTVDPYVRLRALLEYPKGEGAEAPILERFMKTASSPMLRAAALGAIDFLDPGKARDLALEVLADFAAGTIVRTNDEASGADVCAALRVLGKTGGADFVLLKACLRRAETLQQEKRGERGGPVAGPVGPRAVRTVEIAVVPDLIPVLLLELGRTGDPRAVPILLAHVQGTFEEGAAEAALSLGAIGGKEAALALVVGLSSKDGWVRHCSFRGLQALRKDAPFEDWIFTARTERQKRHRDWVTWAEGYEPPAERPREPAELTRRNEKTGDQGGASAIPPPAAGGAGPGELVGGLVAAWEKDDRVEVQRLLAEITSRGPEAVPALISALRRPVVPAAVFDALERITPGRFGLDRDRWLAWWTDSGKKGNSCSGSESIPLHR
jgi:HEAT repeat protein